MLQRAPPGDMSSNNEDASFVSAALLTWRPIASFKKAKKTTKIEICFVDPVKLACPPPLGTVA